MSSGRAQRDLVDERAGVDSGGVYFISVEDFEARKPLPVRKPPDPDPPVEALAGERQR